MSLRNGCKPVFGCCNSPLHNKNSDYYYLMDVSLLNGFTT
jgi:hypothetical protein